LSNIIVKHRHGLVTDCHHLPMVPIVPQSTPMVSVADVSVKLYCSYFRAHPTTLLLKILGMYAWAVPPTSSFGGTVPPRSPPLCNAILNKIVLGGNYFVLTLTISNFHLVPLLTLNHVS